MLLNEDGNIEQKTDYYPFGLVLFEYSDGERNRYLYNGKELQEKTQWLDYGARMYEPSLGRFISVDPLADKYGGISPYNYVGNSPIIAYDPDGQRIIIVGSEEYRNSILNILQQLASSSKTGRSMIYNAITSKGLLVITENKEKGNGVGSKYTDENGNKKALMTFNISETQEKLDKENGLGDRELVNTPEVAMAHELQHFLDYTPGETPRRVYKTDENGYQIGDFSSGELSAVDAENKVRAEMGLPLRTHYGGVNVFNKEQRNNSWKLRDARNPTNYKSFAKYNTTLGSNKNRFQSQINVWWTHNFRTRVGKNSRFGFGRSKVKVDPRLKEGRSTKLEGYK